MNPLLLVGGVGVAAWLLARPKPPPAFSFRAGRRYRITFEMSPELVKDEEPADIERVYRTAMKPTAVVESMTFKPPAITVVNRYLVDASPASLPALDKYLRIVRVEEL